MEILFVSHKYPPAIGGIEKYSFELINGMRKYAKVHAIVYEGKESLPVFFLKLRKRILKCIAENPAIGLVHFGDGLMASVCSFHRGYKHLRRTATLHGLDVVFPSKLYHRYILPRFNCYDHLFAVSAATAEKAVAFGLDRSRVSVIANGVDRNMAFHTRASRKEVEQWLAQKEDGIRVGNRRIFVLMGRPVLRKGFSWLIRHVGPHLGEDAILLIVGPFSKRKTLLEKVLYAIPKKWRHKLVLFLGFPSDSQHIREILADSSLGAQVRHVGKLPQDRIQQLLAVSDAFLMPNIAIEGDMEGFGLVCLEASVMGTVVLAADIDGIPDAIRHGRNGFLLPSGDAAAWVEQVNHIIADTSLYDPYRKSFQRYTLNHCGWDLMVKAYHKVFRALVENNCRTAYGEKS
ncbi:glycosyltransferase family 4 protein [Olivibacter sitiensis]|uniref:glycosyltransferase family 4 protein n=1 Tax=Olivibacter sitiensis TaxID=376470 RepID=UPI0004240BDA|nr:glycosyltransferase family 4 protein [Olivibacter sitiensis]